MSPEVNKFSTDSRWDDSYFLSPEEALTQADYQRCVELADLLGLEVGLVQRVNAWHSALTERVMPPRSEVSRKYTARTFTELATYLEETPLELFDEARLAFTRNRSPLAVRSVAAVSRTCAINELTQQPGAVAKLAQGISNNRNYFDCNVAFVNDLANMGVLQKMRDPKSGEFQTSGLFYEIQQQPSGVPRDPEEARQIYTAQREHIITLLQVQGIDRLIASEAGGHIMRKLVNRMLADSQYDKEGWRKDMAALAAISSDETLTDLNKLAQRNPELIEILLPMGEGGPIDVASCKMAIAQIANQETVANHGVVINIARFIPWPLRIRAAAIAISTEAAGCTRGVESAFADWLTSDRDGNSDTKAELLKDGVFTKGLAEAFKPDWVNRLRDGDRSHKGRIAQLLINETMPDIATSLSCDILTSKINDWSYATTPYVQFYKRFGIDCIDLINTWSRTGFGGKDPDKVQMEHAKDALRIMSEIEAQRPGICRALQDDFFIRNFNRCSPEVWIDQYDNRLTAGEPYAQVALSPEDHNCATQLFAKNHIEALYTNAKRMGRHLRIYEPRTARELLTSMFRSKYRYGDGLMEIGIFIAHNYGQQVSAQLGLDKDGGVLWDIRLADVINDVVIPKMKGSGGLATIMAKNGSALVGSCSSAVETPTGLNLTNAVAVALGAISFGSVGDSYTRNINLAVTADGLRIHDVEFARSDDKGIIYPVATRKYNGPSMREEAAKVIRQVPTN